MNETEIYQLNTFTSDRQISQWLEIYQWSINLSVYVIQTLQPEHLITLSAVTNHVYIADTRSPIFINETDSNLIQIYQWDTNLWMKHKFVYKIQSYQWNRDSSINSIFINLKQKFISGIQVYQWNRNLSIKYKFINETYDILKSHLAKSNPGTENILIHWWWRL